MKKILLIAVILLGSFFIYQQNFFETKPSPEFLQALKLAKQGKQEAKLALGQMYYEGKGVEQDYDEAVIWFLSAGARDKFEKMKEEGTFDKCCEEMIQWFKEMAEKGNAEMQYGLSTMYYNGFDIEQNYEEALKWAEKAAQQGHLEAQYNLGAIYYYGEDGAIEQDYEEALKWLKSAAEQGHKEAIDLIKKIEEETTNK